jgi:heavy metal translocating P-type ATPase
MIKKISGGEPSSCGLGGVSGFFAGLPMTIVSGIFLAASLILLLTHTGSPVDPAWVSVIVSGIPLFYTAVTELLDRRISSPLLISIAIIASIAINEVFAAGEVAFIMAIGAILEDKTVEKAKKGIKKLINLAPKTGRRITNNTEELVPVEQIAAGETLRVLPGEAIPVDGEIISGSTSVDQSIITGESLPVDAGPGDTVFCGTINRFGSIDVRATKVGENSSLQKLIRLVREAENNKAPMQRIVDKWAAWLVPAALVIALATYLVTHDIIRAVTVLVVFCPCALALATPTSIMAAIGQAAKHGVIIKSGDALERMGKVSCISFDKTGTLTHGKLSVSDIISLNKDIPAEKLLTLAASAEAYSEHPLGKAIVEYAKKQGPPLQNQNIEDFIMIPGKGLSAKVNGDHIICGNSAYFKENNVSFNPDAENLLEQLRAQGKAVILVAVNKKCAGLAALSDTLRDTAKSVITELKTSHTKAVLLTGDHRQTADYFAEQAGIDDVYAELLPAQKVAKIQELQNAGQKICMIGDGVNDAPALKTAYVGVAMGSMGSDIAVEAADIALMGDDIAKIPYLKRLAKATVKLIKFNISLSMTINFAAIILSTLALLNPITGALVHNGGSVLVVLNAALLYEKKL